MDIFHQKYLKYKKKYLELKKQFIEVDDDNKSKFKNIPNELYQLSLSNIYGNHVVKVNIGESKIILTDEENRDIIVENNTSELTEEEKEKLNSLISDDKNILSNLISLLIKEMKGKNIDTKDIEPKLKYIKKYLYNLNGGSNQEPKSSADLPKNAVKKVCTEWKYQYIIPVKREGERVGFVTKILTPNEYDSIMNKCGMEFIKDNKYQNTKYSKQTQDEYCRRKYTNEEDLNCCNQKPFDKPGLL